MDEYNGRTTAIDRYQTTNVSDEDVSAGSPTHSGRASNPDSVAEIGMSTVRPASREIGVSTVRPARPGNDVPAAQPRGEARTGTIRPEFSGMHSPPHSPRGGASSGTLPAPVPTGTGSARATDIHMTRFKSTMFAEDDFYNQVIAPVAKSPRANRDTLNSSAMAGAAAGTGSGTGTGTIQRGFEF